MKEYYISLLATGNEIQDFFLVKGIAIKLGSNKKQYLDLLLGDCTGEVTAKKWDVADTELPSLNEIQAGDIVKVKAQVTEWNSMKQLRVLKIRRAVDQDGIVMEDFIKSAPEKPEDMLAFLEAATEEMKDPELKALCNRLLTDNREKLMFYPAAMRNHHAEKAGLLYHMKRMVAMGEYYCRVYTNLNRDLVVTGVIIHDIEKINEIESNQIGIASGYSFEGQLLGHLIQGIKTIDRLAEELGIDTNTLCRWMRERRRKNNLPSYQEEKGITKPTESKVATDEKRKIQELEAKLKAKEKSLADERENVEI